MDDALYYAQAADATTVKEVNNLGSAQTKGIK